MHFTPSSFVRPRRTASRVLLASAVLAALASSALPARADKEPYTVVPGQRVEQTLNVPCALQFDITNKVPTSLDEEHLAWAVTEGKDWSGGNAPPGSGIYTAAYRDYKLKVYAAAGFAGEKSIPGGWNPSLTYTVRCEVKPSSTRYLVTQNGATVADVSISAAAPSRVTMGYGWPPSVRKGATNAILTNIVWEQGPAAPPVTPPSENQFEAQADTYADPTQPTVTHGMSPDLRTGGDGRTTYLRFTVSGVGSVSSAHVILKALNAGGGGQIHFLGDNSWSEATLDWNNRPIPTAAALSSLGTVAIGGEYSFDVSSAVPGDGTYSFAIQSNDNDGSGFHSRESADQHPILEVVPGPYTPPPAGQPPPAPTDAGSPPPAPADAAEPPSWPSDAGSLSPVPPDAAPAADPGSPTDDAASGSCALSAVRVPKPLSGLAFLAVLGCGLLRRRRAL